MFRIEATVEGDKEISVALGLTAEGLSDFSSPLQEVNQLLLHTFDMNFDSRGALLQPPGWAPRKRSYPWPLLEKTGDMRHQFRSDLTKDTLTIENGAPYFKYHQSNKPRKKLPRRIMMKLDAERRDLIIKIFQQYLIKLINRVK